MLELKEVMGSVYTSLSAQIKNYGYEPVFPEGSRRDQIPMTMRGENGAVLDWKGDKGRVRVVFSDNKLILLMGGTDITASDDRDFTPAATFYCDLNEYDQRDVNSINNELRDHFVNLYETDKGQTKQTAITTVSKSAAKSGALSYDPITLAMKLAGMYPGYKDEIKANTEKYGEFLFEEFFESYGNAYILDTIRGNDPKKLKKLFSILNEIYDDGTNEVQSLIVVTILGSIRDDPQLMQNILPYVSDTMAEPVIAVNTYLKKSKNARLRLENPPKYKPKKKKTNNGNPIAKFFGL